MRIGSGSRRLDIVSTCRSPVDVNKGKVGKVIQYLYDPSRSISPTVRNRKLVTNFCQTHFQLADRDRTLRKECVASTTNILL